MGTQELALQRHTMASHKRGKSNYNHVVDTPCFLTFQPGKQTNNFDANMEVGLKRGALGKLNLMNHDGELVCVCVCVVCGVYGVCVRVALESSISQ